MRIRNNKTSFLDSLKEAFRKIMREAGLPIVPGTETPVQGIDEVKKVANEVGYPIMLKALAGGGGKGMRLVRTEEEVETALRLSQSEATLTSTMGPGVKLNVAKMIG